MGDGVAPVMAKQVHRYVSSYMTPLPVPARPTLEDLPPMLEERSHQQGSFVPVLQLIAELEDLLDSQRGELLGHIRCFARCHDVGDDPKKVDEVSNAVDSDSGSQPHRSPGRDSPTEGDSHVSQDSVVRPALSGLGLQPDALIERGARDMKPAPGSVVDSRLPPLDLQPGRGCRNGDMGAAATDEGTPMWLAEERRSLQDAICEEGPPQNAPTQICQSQIQLHQVVGRSARSKKRNEASRELEEMAKNGKGVRAALLRLTGHWIYEVANSILIFANAAVTALETQHAAEEVKAGVSFYSAHFDALMYIFCCVFVGDLFLRIAAQGARFFYATHWRWNMFDIAAAMSYVVEVVAFSWQIQSYWLSNAPVLRVVRLVRIARIVRAFREFAIFREMRITVAMMCQALVPLVTFSPIMLVILMVFGVFFADGATNYFSTNGEDAVLVFYFGDLWETMATLFKSVAGGIDWGLPSRALLKLPFVYYLTFYLYVTFSIFVLFNVISAVFIELTLHMAKGDRDYVVQKEMEAECDFLTMMENVFAEIDDERTGSISLADLFRHFVDPKFKAYFHAIGLDVSKVKKLFVLMDTNASGGIDRNEFSQGCHQLRGEATALDVAILQYELQLLSKDVGMVKAMLLTLSERASIDQRAGSSLASSRKVISQPYSN